MQDARPDAMTDAAMSRQHRVLGASGQRCATQLTGPSMTNLDILAHSLQAESTFFNGEPPFYEGAA
jgi:hypothetical protein